MQIVTIMGSISLGSSFWTARRTPTNFQTECTPRDFAAEKCQVLLGACLYPKNAFFFAVWRKYQIFPLYLKIRAPNIRAPNVLYIRAPIKSYIWTPNKYV